MPTIKKNPEEVIQRTGNKLTALEMQVDALKTTILTFTDAEDIYTLDEELENVQDLKASYQRQLSEYLDYATDEQVATRTVLTQAFETTVKQMVIHMKRLKAKKPSQKKSEKEVKPIVKLQDIPLPSFNGDYCEWVYYKEQILALLINNKSLVDIQKLHYLKNTLTGEAKSVQSAQDTCESLWYALIQRYEIKRNIVENHIKALYNLRSMTRESSVELRQLLATVTKNVRALNAMDLDQNDLSEQLLVNLICSRLDPETRKAYEATLVPQDLPDYDAMMKFLAQRCHTLESIESYKPTPPRVNPKPAAAAGPTNQWKPKVQAHKSNTFVAGGTPQPQPKAQQQQQQYPPCPLCEKSHHLSRCREFIGLAPADRLNKVKTLTLCVNCLRPNHPLDQCKSSFCRQCGSQHHSMLHLGVEQTKPSVSAAALNVTSTSPMTAFLATGKRVLLATVQLLVDDRYGQQHYCRAVLDSASETNFITENMVQNIGAKKHPVQAGIIGINQTDTVMKSIVRATIRSRTSCYHETLDFLVLPKFRSNFPSSNIDIRGWKIPSDITMADPHFDLSGKIDMLLGAEIFFDIWTNRSIELEKGQPPLRETTFGWIVGGKATNADPKTTFTSSTFCATVNYTNADLMNEIRRFWDVESCQFPSSLMSLEERQVEQHFVTTHRRQDDGRYVVCLPTKPSVNQLGDSKMMALKRFGYLERKLSKTPELKMEYTKFIHEYLQLGHMRPSDADQTHDDIEYFLPHHAVLKPSSSTTKLRVVFDASAVTTTGLSLNNVLQVGATIQQELFEILIRFRKYPYAVTADIGKMYRQVLVDEKQHRLQQILWRDEIADEVKAYSLRTVTYGTASAPYLATRALQQLAEDEAADFPLASVVASRDFYVDDVLTGAESIPEALTLQKELIEMCKRGGFTLHKWCSNRQELLDAIPSELCEQKVKLTDDQSVKTLGLTWLPNSDNFVIAIENPIAREREVTKRTILSEIARLFDPLGLTGPVIVSAKIILQKLWQKHADWDSPLDDDDHFEWITYRDQLPDLRQISIPRCILTTEPRKSIKLIGFCDGSTQAYGACIYVLCTSPTGQGTAVLLCSKSRIAPLKTITVPRLELCSAVLLSQLIMKVRAAINIPFDKTVLFSDSTIVLGWIKSQANKTKTFVAHRIAEIQNNTHPADWRHVPTAENPADIISRGLLPNQLQSSTLWWSGPSFLRQPEETWPSTPAILVEDLPEMKTAIAMVVTRTVTCDDMPLLTKYSSLAKIQRVMAYVVRFIANCRTPKSERSLRHLTVPEMSAALKGIILIVQREAFQAEVKSIQDGKPLDKKSPLFRLNAFIDSDKLIRVGGRLTQSDQPFDTKHQIVLPRRCHITTILIRALHEENGHVGPQALLSIVRQTYWPIGAKDITKNITRKCVRCFRYRPRSTEQFMGDLPGYRTNVSHPFVNTGIDYAGPLTLKLTRRTSTKAYIAIFVCMSTKAVHIELVSDLTTKAFLAALSRFISRRGYCSNIYCDNGTNFVGANNELSALYQMFQDGRTQEQIAIACSPRQIAFHFIPPRAPHFGGLWEAAVKSAKYHLVRSVGNTQLTFEEMATVLAKIEAILNSRPLVAESNDPEDVNAITPGHFLIGRPLVAMLEPNYVDVSANRLQRWQLLQKITQHFWKRWSSDYLSTLQKRAKTDSVTNVHPDMIVMIKEDNLPPTQWLLGRVVEIHPGRDGLVRVVKLKTKNGMCTRAVVKLCILPINDAEE